MHEKEPQGFNPSFENSELVDEKMVKWNEISERINETTDRLEHPIEEGIKETVVVLNALGFTTSGSCEGHSDHGARAPYVMLDIDGLREALLEIGKLGNQAYEAPPGKERDELYSQFRSMEQEAEKPLIEKGILLGGYLDRFYENRKTSFDERLIIVREARINLINQGAVFQSARDTESVAKHLAEYQQEMKEFTEFLKAEYFKVDSKKADT